MQSKLSFLVINAPCLYSASDSVPACGFPSRVLPGAKRGEGGIRTLGSLLGYGALAKRCFQPLSHLTKIVATGRATSLRYELRLGKQARDSRRESRISRRIRLFQSAICPCQHRPWS